MALKGRIIGRGKHDEELRNCDRGRGLNYPRQGVPVWSVDVSTGSSNFHRAVPVGGEKEPGATKVRKWSRFTNVLQEKPNVKQGPQALKGSAIGLWEVPIVTAATS